MDADKYGQPKLRGKLHEGVHVESRLLTDIYYLSGLTDHMRAKVGT